MQLRVMKRNSGGRRISVHCPISLPRGLVREHAEFFELLAFSTLSPAHSPVDGVLGALDLQFI
jgi:hypothetical protein